MVLRFVLFVSLNIVMTCGSLASNTPNYTVIEEHDLAGELKETSGLYCPEVGSAYTVNDSGNEPIIYNIDPQGKIINKINVAVKNKDWEALTGDSQYFYIGDVGNNNGKREFVKIHVVPKGAKHNENQATTLRLSYKNNTVADNSYLEHDFDAETLVSVDDKLVLFSKSWDTGRLLIYQLNKSASEQGVEHVSELDGLPGVITGGDYDEQNRRFILVGYELKSFARFYPFIAILNADFSLNRFFELPDYGQVEGVCVTPNGDVWLTQESSFFSKHKLVKLKVAN